MNNDKIFALNTALKMLDQNKSVSAFKTMCQDPAYNQNFFNILVEAVNIELKMQKALVEKIKGCKELSDIIDANGEMEFVNDEEYEFDLTVTKDDVTNFGKGEIKRLNDIKTILTTRLQS
jgi:hypothetical protein